MKLFGYCWLLLTGLAHQYSYSQLVNIAPLPRSEKEPLKVALLIHIHRFKPGSKLLNLSTDNSLTLMLSALRGQGFMSKNMDTLSNENATSKRVRDLFNKFIATKVKGNKKAIVTILLDSHGLEVHDWNGDEPDNSDEAFACYDYHTKADSGITNPEGYILDDELGIYYDNIRREIGPEGHLVVFMPGCHSKSQMKGADNSTVAVIDPPTQKSAAAGQSDPDNQFGKFIYFASVANDADSVGPYSPSKEKSSYLVHGVSQAFQYLTKNITYNDLLATVKHIIDSDLSETDRARSGAAPNIPKELTIYSREKVFNGFVNAPTNLQVLSINAIDIIKRIPGNLEQLLFGKGSSGINEAQLVLVNGGVSAGFIQNGVMEFADATGNNVLLGEIVALNDTIAVVQLDRPVSVNGLTIRRPTSTLWLYADATVPAAIRKSLSDWVAMADSPTDTPLRLSYRKGVYELCAVGLPFTANGCTSLETDSLLLTKVRGLALYQVLRYRQQRHGQVKTEYTSLYQKKSIGSDTLYHNQLVIDTVRTTSLTVRMHLTTSEIKPLYYQSIDVLPDEPLDARTLQPTHKLGRVLSVQDPKVGQPLESCKIVPTGENRINMSSFVPPFGLEENILVFSRAPIDFRSVLAGHSLITAELINSIEYVDINGYYILSSLRQPKR